MKRLFLGLSFLVGLLAWEDTRAGGTQAHGLVDCGADKVTIFEGTASPDNRFALGWTFRPHAGKPPVDWSIYDPDEPWDFLSKVSWEVEKPSAGDYDLVDGVVDLQAKKFTPLQSDFPYWPHKNHGDLSVAWSDERQGTRYVLVANDARFYTHDLWLVQIDPTSVQPVNLITAAETATRSYMHKRDPKDFDRYATIYEIADGTGQGGKAGRTVFGAKTVAVHFETSIPKDEVNSDDGKITFALPGGAVLRVTKK